MKKTFNILTIAFAVLVSFSSCIKDKDIVYEGAQVEIDWATYNARSAGYPFPLLVRVPQEPGRGVITSNIIYGTGVSVTDPQLTRLYASSAPFKDTVTMRINLVGRQLSTAQTFTVQVANTFTTAVSGVHYLLLDNTVTIPANSSFGFCRWRVLNPGPTNGIPVNLVFELKGNATIPVSENYKYIGWQIAQ